MLKRRFLRRLLQFYRKQPPSQPTPLPIGSQICLFNKRPVLHRDFTQDSLQSAIDELQKRLQAKGYLTNLTGRFDLETEQAVRTFQEDNKLFVDGVVGPLTWTCLCYPKLFYRRKQPTAPEIAAAVEELQTILRNEGFTIQDTAGYFGRNTERAIRQFQRRYGLKIDGVVGAVTWAVVLGMRQEARQDMPRSLFRLSPQSLLLCDQLLRVCFIVLGMHLHPSSAIQPPPLSSAIATAYVLSFIVPSLLDLIPVRTSNQTRLHLLKYAPYVCTGMFWQPLFNGFGTLADGLIAKLLG